MLESEVEKETKERQLWSIKCRVAYDLESNWYWKAIGYIPVENTISTWLNQKESKSKRPIIVYEKMLNSGLFALMDVGLNHFLKRQRI